MPTTANGRGGIVLAVAVVAVLSVTVPPVAAASHGDAGADAGSVASASPLTANESGFLRGLVTDLTNNPVRNATVELVDTDNGTVVATVTTRDDGTFGPVRAPVGNYTAVVVDPSVNQSAEKVRLGPDETEEIQVTINRCPSPADITYEPRSAVSTVGDPITYTVTVFDRDGTPVQGAEVMARELTDTPITFYGPTTKTTGPNGTVTFTVNSSVMTTGRLEFEAVNYFGPNPKTTDDDSGDVRMSAEKKRTADFGLLADSLTAPDVVTAGDAYAVSAAVTNNGTVAGEERFQYRVDRDGDGTLENGSEVLATTTLNLSAGETGTVAFDVESGDLAPGEHRHGVVRVNDSTGAAVAEASTITVERRCGLAGAAADADADGDCTISDDEMSTAIAAWGTGTYTDAEIGEVISAWASG